jgi:hypothetical protein
MEFFTNKEKTKEEEVDVASPAFSITKVMAAFGAALAVILGAVPKSLAQDQTIVVAALAAATVILLGVFALSAVDIKTRQRAAEAKLRYGGDGGGKGSDAGFQAIPDKNGKDAVLQLKHMGDEYDVRYASVEKDTVHVFADRDGEQVAVTFKEVPKPK